MSLKLPVRRIATGIAVSAAGMVVLATLVQTLLEGSPAIRQTRGYLLLSIDTLRADHLGAYGYERHTSPFLDELATRGVLFENAIVQIPGTLPSHMSMFTGLYPGEHGVYPPDAVLSPDIPTLPEVFRAGGFRTGGFTEHGYVAGPFGFERGFDEFDDRHLGKPDDVERTLAKALRFLRDLSTSDRFFLFVHTYAVHDPYDPPEPHRSLFWSRPAPETFAPTGPNLTEVNRGMRTVTPEVVEYFEALYDGGIHYLDSVLRRFFTELEYAGLLDDMTVVITSDHGEEFFDHGKLVHEQAYHENLHVPLIVLHPDLEGGTRVHRLVESIDLTATLLDMAGLAPRTRISGETLVPWLVGRPAEAPSEAYAEGVVEPVRSLHSAAPEGVYQLRRSRRHGSWVSRSIEMDLSESTVRLRILSFHEPRDVTIRVDDEIVETALALPDRWSEVDVDLSPETRVRRLSVSSETCDSPRDLAINDDPRCLSFRLRDAPRVRTELYRVSSDPAETNDISREDTALARRLTERLDSYRFGPSARAEKKAIDPEISTHLKALGYLQ